MSEEYEPLRLENQIGFPLYACSKEIVRRYKPFLDELDLTYTQYIAMLVMWEEKHINVKNIGRQLFLDSGTLTPVLKKLEQKGYIFRTRSSDDERVVIINLTEKGKLLKKKAVLVPQKVTKCLNLSNEESELLYALLYKALGA